MSFCTPTILSVTNQVCSCLCYTAARNLVRMISPRPKISVARSRTRKAESATLVTGSPFKNELEKKLQTATAASAAKAAKAASKVAAVGIRNKSKPVKRVRTLAQASASQPSTSKVALNAGLKHKNEDLESSSDEEVWPCIICCEPFAASKSREKWVQCQECQKWAHEACTPGSAWFVCPNCESD